MQMQPFANVLPFPAVCVCLHHFAKYAVTVALSVTYFTCLVCLAPHVVPLHPSPVCHFLQLKLSLHPSPPNTHLHCTICAALANLTRYQDAFANQPIRACPKNSLNQSAACVRSDSVSCEQVSNELSSQG